MTGTGFIDHIGIGVPDLAAAKQYYDELMSVLGLREWFETGPRTTTRRRALTVLRAHNCSSTKPRNRARTHGCKQAFITSHSWSRAEGSSGKHTSGRLHATPSSSAPTRPSSPSTARTVLRPTGLILMDSSSRRFATVPKNGSTAIAGIL